jgi:hypothetical protein
MGLDFVSGNSIQAVGTPLSLDVFYKDLPKGYLYMRILDGPDQDNIHVFNRGTLIQVNHFRASNYKFSWIKIPLKKGKNTIKLTPIANGQIVIDGVFVAAKDDVDKQTKRIRKKIDALLNSNIIPNKTQHDSWIYVAYNYSPHWRLGARSPIYIANFYGMLYKTSKNDNLDLYYKPNIILMWIYLAQFLTLFAWVCSLIIQKTKRQQHIQPPRTQIR